MTSLRERIVAEAAAWRGTPYRHQASLQHVGCDCLGLVRGVWRGVVGAEPEKPPPYSPDWAEATGADTLLEAARRHLVEIAIGAAQPGDVLLFRIAAGRPAKHAAIISKPGQIIHAYWGQTVCETRLTSWWERRIAGAFAFPGGI